MESVGVDQNKVDLSVDLNQSMNAILTLHGEADGHDHATLEKSSNGDGVDEATTPVNIYDDIIDGAMSTVNTENGDINDNKTIGKLNSDDGMISEMDRCEEVKQKETDENANIEEYIDNEEDINGDEEDSEVNGRADHVNEVVDVNDDASTQMPKHLCDHVVVTNKPGLKLGGPISVNNPLTVGRYITELYGMENIIKTLMCTAGMWLQKPELFHDFPNAFYKAGTIILFGPHGCGQFDIIQGFAEMIPGCKLIEVSAGPVYENKALDLLATKVLQEAEKAISVVVVNFDKVLHFGQPKEENFQKIHKRVADLLKAIQERHCRCVVFLKGESFQSFPPSIRDQFATHIYVPLPEHGQRLHFIKERMTSLFDDCSGLNDEQYGEISYQTAGWSYRDIRFTIDALRSTQIPELIIASTHLVVIPPEPCSDCIAESKTDELSFGESSRQYICSHQKIHSCSPETPGAIENPSHIMVPNNDCFFVTCPDMDKVRSAFSGRPLSFLRLKEEAIQYFEDYATSHGHYTAYRGRTKELDSQPPYTNEPLKSLNAVYSLKQTARMEVLKAIDDKDMEVLWERASQLPIPMMLRLYVMNENIGA